MEYKIIAIRDNPEYLNRGIDYFSLRWGNKVIFLDAISISINTNSTLPRFYLLTKGDVIVGCYGIITNDFVSRMDLWPYLCALYIEESQRGQNLGAKLINHCKEEVKKLGFSSVYLVTDHIGYYEKFGFKFLGIGYHPWDEQSRIYGIDI